MPCARYPIPAHRRARRRPGPGRRGFLGWVLAAPTLVVGASIGAESLAARPAAAAIPSPPEVADVFDLGDLQDLAALPTSNLITVGVNEDGTASFALPRAEVGQGITTSSAMLIAEELDLPLDKVTGHAGRRPPRAAVQPAHRRVELHPLHLRRDPHGGRASPARSWSQAAAKQWGVDGVDADHDATASCIGAAAGRPAYGSLDRAAAVPTTDPAAGRAQGRRRLHVVGTPQNRIDALRGGDRHASTFAMDLDVPGALPTMIARPPTINGTLKSVENLAAVQGDARASPTSP